MSWRRLFRTVRDGTFAGTDAQRCEATVERTGEQCRAATVRGGRFCVYHEPGRAAELRRRSVEARRRKAAEVSNALDTSQGLEIPLEPDPPSEADHHGQRKRRVSFSRRQSGGQAGPVFDLPLIPPGVPASSENFAHSTEPSRASIFQERREPELSPVVTVPEPTVYPFVDRETGLLVTMPAHLRDRHVQSVEPVAGVNGPPSDEPAPRTRILGGSWDGFE